jgi:hypothetical protein
MNDQPVGVSESEEIGRRWDAAMIIKGKFMNGKQAVCFNVTLLPQHSQEMQRKAIRRYMLIFSTFVSRGFYVWINRSG